MGVKVASAAVIFSPLDSTLTADKQPDWQLPILNMTHLPPGLSDCQVVRLSGCQVVRLSGCQVVCWEHLSKPPLGEEERLLDPPPQGRALPISLPMMVEGRRVPGLAAHHHHAQVALQAGLHGTTAPPQTEQQSWERWLLAVVVAASAADQGFPPPPPHRRAHWSRSHPRLVPANIRPHTDFIFTQIFQKHSHAPSFHFDANIPRNILTDRVFNFTIFFTDKFSLSHR